MHQFLQLRLFLITARHLFKCDLILIVQIHFRPAFAEGGHFTAAPLHTAKEEHEENHHHNHQNQGRQNGGKQAFLFRILRCHGNLPVAFYDFLV